MNQLKHNKPEIQFETTLHEEQIKPKIKIRASKKKTKTPVWQILVRLSWSQPKMIDSDNLVARINIFWWDLNWKRGLDWLFGTDLARMELDFRFWLHRSSDELGNNANLDKNQI